MVGNECNENERKEFATMFEELYHTDLKTAVYEMVLTVGIHEIDEQVCPGTKIKIRNINACNKHMHLKKSLHGWIARASNHFSN